jgi:PAP2 superfamily
VGGRRLTGVRDVFVQLALITFGVLMYFGVRGQTEGTETTAIAHAIDLLELERAVGLDLEYGLQARILDTQWIVTAANWVYIWGHWPAIAASALWLYHTHRPAYIHLRDAFFVSGVIGMIIFALYPVAPPRLAGLGFIDTVTERSHSYRVLQPPGLVNRFAAMPSLHVGWNVALGVTMFRATHQPLARVVALLLPAAMSFAVVATGNHFVIDAIAGATLAMFGYWVAARWPLGLWVAHLRVGTHRRKVTEQVVAVGDEPVDTPLVQATRRRQVVDAPRHHHAETTAEFANDASVQEGLIDGHPVQITGPKPSQQAGELRPASG